MGLSSQLAPSSLARPGVCTSSTRPASPYEGQVIYTTDTDLLQIWNGTAWRTLAFATPTNGSILQIVNSAYGVPTQNNTTTYADTGLSATITPKSTSNKVLVITSQNGCAKLTGNTLSHLFLRLMRDSTEISLLDVGGGYTGSSIDNLIGSISSSYLDSPNTTSAVIYKTQFKNNTGASGVSVQINSSVSTMTLMEIAA